VEPYAAAFAGSVVCPVAYAVWLAGRPSLFIELVEDPFYLPAIVNSLSFVGIGVGVTMFAALFLSGSSTASLVDTTAFGALSATVADCGSAGWRLVSLNA
jgi:hypothetical protein